MRAGGHCDIFGWPAAVEHPKAFFAELAAATRTLEGLRQGLNCDNILSQARATQGVIGADLGESDVANLAPQFQQFARTGEIGSVSTPIRTPLGLHLVAVMDLGLRQLTSQVEQHRRFQITAAGIHSRTAGQAMRMDSHANQASCRSRLLPVAATSIQATWRGLGDCHHRVLHRATQSKRSGIVRIKLAALTASRSWRYCLRPPLS